MSSRAMKTAPKKPPVTETHSGMTEGVEERETAALAYRLWEQRGRPVGSPEEDWYRAQSELKARRGRAPSAA
jgi:hypothetical protein